MKRQILLFFFCILLGSYLPAQRSYFNFKQQPHQHITSNFFKQHEPKTNSRSNNNVEIWNKVASAVIPIGHEVTSMKMADENTIWMTTFGFFGPEDIEASILKSLDGGLTWEVLSLPNLPDHYPFDITAINGTIAYASMLDGGPSAADGNILDALFRTTDGGQTWSKVENYPYSPLLIHFFNENEGWVMGEADDFVEYDDIIMSTTSDGGQTWSHLGGADWVIPEGRMFPARDSAEINIGSGGYATTSSYDVVGNSILIGTTNRYWISSDKGNNWQSFNSPLYSNDNLYTSAVAMKDEQTFMLASNFEAVDFIYSVPKAYATTDGGQTWVESAPPVLPAAIAYLPGTDNSFIIAGHNQFSANSGLSGTARTDDFVNWEYVDDKGILAVASSGNKLFGTFGNFPNLGETGEVFSWGEAVIPDYDALIFRENHYTYTEVTLKHVAEAVTLNYSIQSTGLNDLMNTTFYFDVLIDDVLEYRDSSIIELTNAAESSEISFSYLPEKVGIHVFRIYASQENIGNQFYQDIQYLNVNETTLNKDDGGANSGISLSFISPEHYGYLGTEYKLLQEDQLQAISLLLDPDSTANFHLIVKAVDENGVAKEGEVFKSELIAGVNAITPNFIYTHILKEPLTLEPGNYIFASGQDKVDGVVVHGFDTDRIDETFWVYNAIEDAMWTKSTNGTIMIRPHFGDFMVTNTAEELFAQSVPLIVFPVPFTSHLNILLEYVEEPTATLQLLDMTGKQIAQFQANHHQLITRDFSDLANGMYFLQIKSGQYQRTMKVVKQ